MLGHRPLAASPLSAIAGGIVVGVGTAAGGSTAPGAGAANFKKIPGKGGGGKGGAANVFSVTTSPTTTQPTGSTFVVVVQDSTAAPAITDSFGNTYVQRFRTGNGTHNLGMYVCQNGVGGDLHTATATFSTLDSPGITFLELTGVLAAPLDVDASRQDNASPYTVTSPSSTQDIEIVVSVIGTDSADAVVTHVESTGFTQVDSPDNGALYWSGAVAVKTVYAAGAFTPSWTASGASKAIVGVATFKADALTLAEGTGTAEGGSTAEGVGASLAEGVGTAEGGSTAEAVGAGVIEATGTAEGGSTAEAEGASVAEGVGTAEGGSTAEGVSPYIAEGTGSADGGSSAEAVGVSLVPFSAAQASWLESVVRLHGLLDPLVVSAAARGDGTVAQTVEDADGTVTMTTTATPAGVPGRLVEYVELLARLHGVIDPLVVTATSRGDGTLQQTITEDAGVVTVEVA